VNLIASGPGDQIGHGCRTDPTGRQDFDPPARPTNHVADEPRSGQCRFGLSARHHARQLQIHERVQGNQRLTRHIESAVKDGGPAATQVPKPAASLDIDVTAGRQDAKCQAVGPAARSASASRSITSKSVCE
jgi:hypothetical protein